MKKRVSLILTVLALTLLTAGLLTACGKKGTGEEITIVFTNDIHSYIDNSTTDEDGNITGDGLRFSKVAAMVEDLKAEGKKVLLVDAGDEVQGDIYGAMDRGEQIIDIMNTVGYDLATVGNHDFDYGVERLFELQNMAQFPYVSSNFKSAVTGEQILPATHIFEFDSTKVAFIGVITPEVYTSSTPAYFQNEQGEYIYTFDGCEQPSDLYKDIQDAIDSVRDNVDYVIVLGHIGVGAEEKKAGISAEDIIVNTTGLDAFISGHSHTVIENTQVKDKSGKDVLLTQTGNYLQNIGVMTIGADGKINSKLVSEYDRENEQVAQKEKEWINEVESKMNEQIAVLDSTLYINNPEDKSKRMIRATEMNLGDMTADSIYWFFNERMCLDCDIALVNSGGIRAQITQGNISYFDVKKVCPFGDMICLVSATGQQILDALEMGAAYTGEWDDELDIPAENGGFLQAAGLTYTIDASIPSSVEMDKTGLFKAVNGEYRVKDVQVYNRASGQYEPLELTKVYQLGGNDYMLHNSGNGLCMFKEAETTIDYAGQDYVILAEYMKNFLADGDYARVTTSGSPLASYPGYLMNYEEPYGSGRITILNVDYEK